ncbi:MAG: PTS sugar transporter subunit IIA [Lentisphaeria bacterium]|nr:PTS sugar transporter subunit IIA [Lentisphaeria bacterium]
MSEEQKNALTLSGFLSEDRILILSGKQEKDDVLNALIETLAEVPEIDGRDDVARGIFHRESLLSTGIGNGIGVPHVRLTDLDESYMALAVVPEGISGYEALDDQPVKIVFMVVAGKDQRTLHVKLLQSISALFSDSTLTTALLAATDPQNCLDAILRHEQK